MESSPISQASGSLQRRAERAGAAIFLNSPKYLNLGVDYAEWKAEERNRTTKDNEDKNLWVITGLEPGAHFIYWTDGESGREGEFIDLLAREVIVFQWSSRQSLFLRVLDEDEINRWKTGHDNLSLMQCAVVYPPDWIRPWRDVSWLVTRFLLSHLAPPTMTTKDADLSEYREAEREGVVPFDEKLENLLPFSSWTDIPAKYTGAKGNDADSRTKLGMDKSGILEKVLEHYKEEITAKQNIDSFSYSQLSIQTRHSGLGPDEVLLLGEVQMAYIKFLLGSDLDAMEHWKKLLVLLTNCESLSDNRVGLCKQFIRLFYHQLDQCPDDLLLSDITKSNFIIDSVINIVEMLEDASDITVRKYVRTLKNFVEQKFKMTIIEMSALQENGPATIDL